MGVNRLAIGVVGLLLLLGISTKGTVQVANADPEFSRYIVVLHGGHDPVSVASTHAVLPDHVYRHALNGFSANIPTARLEGLRHDPRVAYIEEDQLATTLDAPTGLKRIFADINPNLDIDSADDWRVDVDVAVIDTGIDYTHPDLNVVFRTNCAQGGPLAQNCTDNAGTDGNGHGTHVAGTIGALDNTIGVVGVAAGARLWAIRVLDNGGSGYYSWIIAGVDKVTALAGQIEVANMSLGGGSSTALCNAIANSVNAGVVYAVAAGNSDANANGYSPANCADVITVSALADFDGAPGGLGSPTCRSDQDDTLADFSNYGSSVEIAAPGVCIDSTWPGGYNTISGTSMASPHVAGAAALLASKSNPNSKTDVESIRTTLINTGNLNWTDDSGDGIKERLLDVSNTSVFNPVLIPGSGGSPNTTPTANNVSAATNEDNAVGVGLSGSDPETCDLTFSIVGGPSNGSLGAISSNLCAGSGPYTDSAAVTYTPNANFNGSDFFTYKANDGSASSNTGTVSITVNAADDSPVPANKSTNTTKNTGVAVILNATDVDGCSSALSFSVVTSPAHGTLGTIGSISCTTGNYAASVTYMPANNYTGPDSFTYKANDGLIDSNTATISITVSNVSDITLSAIGYKLKGLQKADLSWSGATSSNVDVYRNGGKIMTTANDGFYTDPINKKGGGSYTYKVCEAGTTTCSSEVTVTF